MEILRWIGFGAFFVSSLAIGIRLLQLARRTAQIPELLIGISVLCIGPIGCGLSMLALAFRGPSTVLSATLQGSSFVAVFVGSLIHAVVRAATGRSVMELPVASLIISVCGLTAARCMGMAFHPRRR